MNLGIYVYFKYYFINPKNNNDIELVKNEIDLNENPKAFTKFSNNSKYVFYSNIYNLSDEDYQILANQYSSIMYLKRHRIFVSILKKD